MTPTSRPSDGPAQTRPRRVTRQREAGEATRRETRRRLLVAAAEEFHEQGYRAATVARIADRAGVAIQTLYHSWGSKRDLLRGVLDQALTGSEEGQLSAGELPQVVMAEFDPQEAVDHPEALVRHLVHQFRVLAERSASVWRTYRDAAAVDPDISADWHALMVLRRANYARLLDTVPADRWRTGLTRDDVVDTAWTIASPHTHELLVTDAGYDYDRYETWVLTTLQVALFD